MNGVAHEGLTITTRDGRRARLAVMDYDGSIVEEGLGVEREVFNVAVKVDRNFPQGKGYLRVHFAPPNGKDDPQRSAR